MGKKKNLLVFHIVFGVILFASLILAIISSYGGVDSFVTNWEYDISKALAWPSFNIKLICLIVIAVCAATILIVDIIVDSKEKQNLQPNRRRRY